jgi:hypothetical protein
LIAVGVIALVFGFTPISHALLRSVDGSFAPSRYSSLALQTPSDAVAGYLAGSPVAVELTNHTGSVKTYRWIATQNGALVSVGEKTVASGRVTTINVPTPGAVTGKLRIALSGTNIFVTVPVAKL